MSKVQFFSNDINVKKSKKSKFMQLTSSDDDWKNTNSDIDQR
jgi:hypothetical protein